MKKLRNTILLLIAVFFIGVTGVNAAAVGYGNGYQILTESAIPARTYIIGTHMFTRETNADYPGYLTTKLIMMASRTIESDEELIIYYKTPNGTWIDSLDGSSIEPKNSFVIERVNARFDEKTLSSPYLNIYFDKDSYVSGNKNFELYYEKDIEIEVGIEIYRSEEYDGNYTLYETISEEEYDEWEPVIGEVERGKKYYYKARFFKEYSDKIIYSEFSYPEYLDNADIRLYLEKSLIDFKGNKSVKLKIDAPDAAEDVNIFNYIYECDEEKCTSVYDIIDTFSKEEFDNIYIDVPVGTEYELVAESYGDDYYFEASNSVIVSNVDSGVHLNAMFKETAEEKYIYELTVNEELLETTSMNLYYKEVDTTAGFTFLKEVTANKVNVEVPVGKTYVFKVVLNDTDTQIEGISSNEVSCYTTLQKPIIGYSYNEEGYTLEVTKIGLADKLEFYSSETENGKYKLLAQVTIDELKEEGLYNQNGSVSLPIIMLPGSKLYFKVRTMGTVNGETKISELSDYTFIENVPFEYEYEYISTDIYNNEKYVISVTDYYAQGIEVYYSEENVEENYKLLTSSDGTQTTITIPEGKEYFIKVRTYNVYDNEKEYNKFIPTIERMGNEYQIILDKYFDSYEENNYLYNLFIGFNSYDGYFEPLTTVGMEVYCSKTSDEVRSLVEDVYDEYDVLLEVPEGEERYCHASLYEKVDGQKQYGISTNTVILNTLTEVTPEMRVYDIRPYEDKAFVIIDLLEELEGPIEGAELYTSDTKDGTYKLISDWEYADIVMDFEVAEADINKFYKIRTYVTAGEEKVYSQYSNASEFKFDKIELSLEFSGCYIEEEIPCVWEIYAQHNNEDTTYSLEDKNMQVYVKTADSEDFELLADVQGNMYEIRSSNIDGNIYKVKMYVGSKETGVYSDWSNEVSFTFSPVEIELEPPKLNVASQGQVEPGSYVYDLSINYKDYIIYESEDVTISQIAGWELYLDYTVEGKEYIEVDGTNYTMVADHTQFGVVPRDYIWGSGESYNYIARAYYYEGEEKIYSDWSEVLTINEEILQNKEQPNQLISFEELETKLENKETFMLEIVQTSCSHCDSFTTKFNKILTEYSLNAVTINLSDLTVEENKKLDDLYNVSGTPTVIFVKEGKEDTNANRIIGDRTENSIISNLEAAGYI